MALGLGRRPAPDTRDGGFPLRAILPAATTRRYRYWWAGDPWLDQGSYPHCVGYSWTHWVEASPITYPAAAPVDPDRLYHEAQLVDEWPGEGYDGTSVRAGAKVLQSQGFISNYRWAFDLATLQLALLEAGPVVVGTNWYERMFHPAPTTGRLQISGDVAGGHAYLLDGINLDTGWVRIKNSWGRGWGINGRARISLQDIARLIDEEGEACLATEVRG